MNKRALTLPLLVLATLTCSDLTFAANALQHGQNNQHKPVATILPEAGKLAGEDGVLHQGLALECAGGKPGGISYFSPENDLDIAIDAPVNIEINVDHNNPVIFSATRIFNAKAPDALTSKSNDADNEIRLIHYLKTTQNDVKVKVINPIRGKSKTFRLKGKDMSGTVKSFQAYCDVK